MNTMKILVCIGRFKMVKKKLYLPYLLIYKNVLLLILYLKIKIIR